MGSYDRLNEETDIELASAPPLPSASIKEKEIVEEPSERQIWILSIAKATGLILSGILGLILLGILVKVAWPGITWLILLAYHYDGWIGFVIGMLIVYSIMGIGIYLFKVKFQEFIQNAELPDVTSKKFEYGKWVTDKKAEEKKKREWQDKQKERLCWLFLCPLGCTFALGIIFMVVVLVDHPLSGAGVRFYIYLVSNILYLISLLVTIIMGVALKFHPKFGRNPAYLAEYKIDWYY